MKINFEFTFSFTNIFGAIAFLIAVFYTHDKVTAAVSLLLILAKKINDIAWSRGTK